MNNPHLERGLLLYQQSRHELAENELRQALAADPQDAFAHALLALCLNEREQFEEATTEVRQAIHLAPDFSFAHFAHARVLYARNHYPEARAAIEEAIRLDSTDADYFSLLASIHFDERQWPEALAAAEQGLQFDSEHIGCTNLRAMAMVKLGRKAEAGTTIDAALARNPDNAITHANQGWTWLEKGDSEKALEHFREALRLDPDNEWARHGIVEALKARHFIYAAMLKYFLWMSKLSRQAQWGIILGGYFGHRLLGSLADNNPVLAPWVLPLQILYITFAVLTWTAYPMFNLILRLNRFGRLALTPEQTVESNWVGTSFLLALFSLGGCLAMGFESPWVMSLAVFGLMVMPLSGLFRCSVGWPRTTMIVVVAVLAFIGLGAIGVIWEAHRGGNLYAEATANRAFGLLGTYAIGVLLTTVLANILAAQRPKR
jgi:tetratricopeptide (TPR) repeat protein